MISKGRESGKVKAVKIQQKFGSILAYTTIEKGRCNRTKEN